MAPSFQTSGANSVNTSFSTSFNNNVFSSQETANTATTSFTSYNGDTAIHKKSIPDSRQSNRTSSTTAYSSDDDALFQAEMQCGMPSQNHGTCEQDIQVDLNRIFPQESSEPSRFTFGSIDEDVLVNAPFETERAQNALDSKSRAQPPVHSNDRRRQDTPTADSPAHNDTSDTHQQIPASLQSVQKMSYDIRVIPGQNLFVDTLRDYGEFVPFFVLFICLRIATESSISWSNLVNFIAEHDFNDPQIFWGSTNQYLRRLGKPVVKLGSLSRLWQASKQQFNGYTFKANITLSSKTIGPVMYLNSLTVQAEKSCRLQRMFGSDRFLYVRSPYFDSSKTTRFNKEETKQIRDQWQKWLLKEHSFLGRKWRVFHIEHLKKGKASSADVDHDMRIVLFATEGADIDQPYTIGQMINKFLPIRLNKHQSLCKAFARIDLGLSRTIPTLCFETWQMKDVPNKQSTEDPEDTQFNDMKLDWPSVPDKIVMDDGCCTMSVGAAKEIWKLYKEVTGVTGPLPSAFQGRIGGAKGLWVISAEPFTKEPDHLKLWIKINESQKKFSPPIDQPPDHRTFEVSNYSSAPSPSELHASFIPILVDRGVSREAISNLMSDCLETERMKLLDVLRDPVKLHELIYRNGTKTSSREEAPQQAGLPLSLQEKLLLLLESGFDPLQCSYLAQSLERFIQTKQIAQEAKLRVPLPKSTNLYGVADPLGKLEPGEIQVQFSTSFIVESSDERYICLRNMDALVARQPACRRSDMQRVRTVVHPDLSHLVDVVVFSSKGPYPLAGKLQGGDYDGDIFWICWEPTLVQPFSNAPAPVHSPDPSRYGIEVMTEKLEHVVHPDKPDNLDNLFSKAFTFRCHSSLLGQVTVLGENYSYRKNCIHSEVHEQLYDIHDLLVDASKQGYILTKDRYRDVVRRLCGERRLGQPAYKMAIDECTNANSKDVDGVRKKTYCHNRNNVLDYLYFDIVRAYNNETMKQVKEVLANACEEDEALLYPCRHLDDKQSVVFKRELLSLDLKLSEVHQTWNTTWHSSFKGERLKALVDECYQKYLAIKPDNPDDPEMQPLMWPYLRPGSCLWDTIKASALYRKYSRPEKLNFVFNMAGCELVKLKADSITGTRSMVLPIRANLKPKRVKAPVQGGGVDGDEYGYDEDDDDDFVSVLE